ncbi:MAG: TlpA family protein disulfide reductase [Eubacteriaceae bacterium]|nr:TlpA family protein disulfide reductase [Eubacteriaceae bacterium]
MNSKKKLLILILAFVLLIGGAAVMYNILSDDADVENLAGTDAGDVVVPDFTVYDKDMNPVKLSDFRGKPVIVSFWASWCGVCKAEMPDFNAAYEKYGDEVMFMMINVTDGTQETKESADEFLATVDYTFPIYYDTTLEAGIKYGVSALPTSFFINSDGGLVGWGNYIDAATLEQAIGDMLK